MLDQRLEVASPETSVARRDLLARLASESTQETQGPASSIRAIGPRRLSLCSSRRLSRPLTSPWPMPTARPRPNASATAKPRLSPTCARLIDGEPFSITRPGSAAGAGLAASPFSRRQEAICGDAVKKRRSGAAFQLRLRPAIRKLAVGNFTVAIYLAIFANSP